MIFDYSLAALVAAGQDPACRVGIERPKYGNGKQSRQIKSHISTLP